MKKESDKSNQKGYLKPKKWFFMNNLMRKNFTKARNGHKSLIVGENKRKLLNLSLTEDPFWGKKKNIEITPPSKKWRNPKAYLRKDMAWHSRRFFNPKGCEDFRIRNSKDIKKISDFIERNKNKKSG